MSIVRRYTLVLEGKIEKRHLFSRKERVEEICKKIEDYNSVRSNPYFIGDLIFNRKTRTLEYRKYTKISKPSTLSEIDYMTTKLEDESSLKRILHVSDNSNIFVAYRHSRRLKLLKVFYRDGINYLNEYYLENKIMEYSKDINFVKIILNNKLLESFIYSKDQFDKLKSNLNNNYLNVNDVSDFFFAYVYPKGEKSYFNLRFLSNIVREYESTLVKNNENIEEDVEHTPGQIMLDGFNCGYLTEFNEEAKLGILTEKELKKKLIM